MKFPLGALLSAALCLSMADAQSTYEYRSVSGEQGTVNGALDGYTVADHYGTSSYSGYVGEMGLVFNNQSSFSGISGTPQGTFRGDAGDIYDNQVGLVVFCIDSETPFVGSGTSSVQTYVGYGLIQAEQRYLTDGVAGYTPGGLRRAAYLLETFYNTAHNGGNLEAASMQSAIWEVLTDSTPSLATGDGNYYVRNNTGNATTNQRSNDIISLTNTWFSAATADNWGGPAYNPDERVVFWIDPNDTSNNQSVISLNPVFASDYLISVPEPSAAVLLLGGGLLLLRRRR